MSKATVNDMTMSIVEPQERIRQLSKYGNMIEVDRNMPITRYYRSGTEMLRMANVYLSEGNHENAFILYMKYMTLFIEKIRTHPDYANIKQEVKAINKTIKEEIMPTTEKLRAKLLDRYQQEHKQFLANKEAEEERQRQKQQEERQRNGGRENALVTLLPTQLRVQIDADRLQPTAPDLALLDKVVYPNDFPTGTNRVQLPGTGLILHENDKNKPQK